jgi:N-acetylmuramoyl-L-alanine amidase
VNTQVGDAFSAWQVEVTARIVRYCWAKYPNLVHVVSHAKLDPTRRSDPGADFPWVRFRQLVLDGSRDAVPAVARKAVSAGRLKAPRSVVSDCCTG